MSSPAASRVASGGAGEGPRPSRLSGRTENHCVARDDIFSVVRPTIAAAGFVLTGGQSRRLGRDKALLELGGRPLVLRTVERLKPVVAQVSLVGAPERYAHLGLPLLADPDPANPGRGPLAGIVAALAASEHDWNLVVACDLPYLESRFLEFLLEQAAADAGADAVIPFVEGRWQPLCAAYHRRSLAVFERVLATGDTRIARAFEHLRVRALTAELLHRFAFNERIFKNMNTPEEYEEVRRELGAQR